MDMLITTARSIMTHAHKDQTRWDGRPYSVHPEKVVSILRDFGTEDPNILAGAYLHDVLEDTAVTEDDLKQDVGEYVTSLVKELTFQDSKNNDQLYYDQCAKLSKHARIIKIADILANLSDGKHSSHFMIKRVNALSILLAEKS